jgi:ABC-type branched-subunit amino acid transport system ATPase component
MARPLRALQRIFVRDLADTVLLLHYGRELAYGLADTVPSDPQVIEAYIGKR